MTLEAELQTLWFATVSTRTIALPAYRSFRLDYNFSGFTQGLQIPLCLYYTLFKTLVNTPPLKYYLTQITGKAVGVARPLRPFF